jgi:hypothetical protein
MTPEEQRKAALDEFKLLYKHGEKFSAEIMVKCFIWCEKYQNDIEAALSAPEVQQWQDIETAPMDNVDGNDHVLLSDGVNVTMGYFVNHGPHVEGELYGPEDNYWAASLDGNDYGLGISMTPTHWMPVPPPSLIFDKVKE